METDQTRTQTIVFLRHGVAAHNFRGAELTSPSLFDPSLTYDGKLAAVNAGERIKHWWRQHNASIDLILCSPLTRTLQTTSLAFLPDEYSESSPRILCVENLREAFGIHYPDKRRERSVLVVSEQFIGATKSKRIVLCTFTPPDNYFWTHIFCTCCSFTFQEALAKRLL